MAIEKQTAKHIGGFSGGSGGGGGYAIDPQYSTFENGTGIALTKTGDNAPTINYQIVGTDVTVSSTGVAEGFSNTSFIVSLQKMPSVSSVVMDFEFTMPAVMPAWDIPIFSVDYGIRSLFINAADKVLCQYDNSTLDTGVTSLEEGQTYKGKYIWQNGTATASLYVGGVWTQQFSVSRTFLNVSDYSLCIGGKTGLNQPFTGKIELANTRVSFNDNTWIWEPWQSNQNTAISFYPSTISGYDATKTQVLKNVNGTLTWVDE